MARFGETFSYLMKQYGMTAEQVAPKIGCKTSNISKLKRKSDVDTDMLERVCRFFCVSPMMFLSPDLKQYPGSSDITSINNNAVLGQATMTIGTSEEVNNLKALLEEKDKQLAEKERFIQYFLCQTKSTDTSNIDVS